MIQKTCRRRRFCLFPHACALLALFLRDRRALFRHTLTREVVLQDGPEEGNDGNNDEQHQPVILLFAQRHVVADEQPQQNGEDHRACTRRAEQRHVDERRKDAALFAVARRERR